MTHEENMKVISQAIEEEIERTGPPPYATVQDKRSQGLTYGGAITFGGNKIWCYIVLVDGMDVWGESNAGQSSDNAQRRCNILARLLQEAYDKGYAKGTEK